MKKIISKVIIGLILTLIVLPFGLTAQVCSGNITLSSQADVNAFACTSITGNLIIQGADINDLNPLASLTSIGGYFLIETNTLLTNLDGLNSLVSVGLHMRIVDNSQLLNIDGLANLSEIGGFLTIQNNDLLPQVDGLSSLLTLGDGLYIRFNDVLADIDGLSNLNSTSLNVIIESNPALKNIDGLSSLSTIGGSIRIEDNDALLNIDGLSSVTTVPGFVYIKFNDVLTNLDGLSSFSNANGIIVESNPNLDNLDGLSSLETLNVGLYIDDNHLITNVNGLSSLTSVGIDFVITDNLKLSGYCGLYPLFDEGGLSGSYTMSGNALNPTQSQILNGGPCNDCPGDITLSNQAEVDAFSCSSVSGNLVISGADIDDLSSLSILQSIGGYFLIETNTSLMNLDGLSSLVSVDLHMRIVDNSQLLNIDGLANLSEIGGFLTIQNNDLLPQVDGLSSLLTLGDGLYIRFNDVLADIDGLSSLNSTSLNVIIESNPALKNIDGLSSLSTIGGSIRIEDNDALLNIDGLSSVTTVPGFVYIKFNDVLTNLDGLSSFSNANGIIVESNPNLDNLDGLSSLETLNVGLYIDDNHLITNVNGLSSLTTVGTELQIIGNTNLSEFCGLFPLIDGGGLAGTYSVTGNIQNPAQSEIVNNGPCTSSCDNFTVNLKDSEGNFLQGGVLEYREGGGNPWRLANEISDGIFCIYTTRYQVGLRMQYGPQIEKIGAVSTSSDHTFQTVLVTVVLEDNGAFIDGGEVDYTSIGWHSFGTTGDNGAGTGSVSKEMLPLQYTFRMKYIDEKESKTEIISSSNDLISFSVSDLKTTELNDVNKFLISNYPNPFTSKTTIAFTLEQSQGVSIKVFDLSGKQIKEIYSGLMEEGTHKLKWDASGLHKGMYIVRCTTNGQVYHKNIIKL